MNKFMLNLMSCISKCSLDHIIKRKFAKTMVILGLAPLSTPSIARYPQYLTNLVICCVNQRTIQSSSITILQFLYCFLHPAPNRTSSATSRCSSSVAVGRICGWCASEESRWMRGDSPRSVGSFKSFFFIG